MRPRLSQAVLPAVLILVGCRSYSGASARPAGDRTPVSGQQAPGPPQGEYDLGDKMATWKASLKNGAIEYHVPSPMTAQVASDVTVNIHGYQDVATKSLPQQTGSGTLAVSSLMKVDLLAPADPSEFSIVPGSNATIQFVPNDTYASWTWKVTPTNKAPDEQLLIRVSLVYQSPKGNIERILVDKYYPVAVRVQKLTTTLGQNFWHDPIAWFQYMLPGGKGWSTLAGIFVFLGGGAWVKRKFFSGKDSPKT